VPLPQHQEHWFCERPRRHRRRRDGARRQRRGIGGCPFAPAATGNIATDDLIYMLERMRLRTGIDLAALLPTAGFLGEQLGYRVPAMLPRAGLFPSPQETSGAAEPCP
jgi:hypothetical protein